MTRPGVRSWLGRAGTPIAANPRMSEESVSVTPSRWVPPKTLFTTVPSLLQDRQWWVSGGWDQTLTRTMQKYVTLTLFLSLNPTSGSLRWTWCRETLFLFPEWSHWVNSPFLFSTIHFYCFNLLVEDDWINLVCWAIGWDPKSGNSLCVCALSLLSGIECVWRFGHRSGLPLDQKRSIPFTGIYIQRCYFRGENVKQAPTQALVYACSSFPPICQRLGLRASPTLYPPKIQDLLARRWQKGWHIQVSLKPVLPRKLNSSEGS